MRVIPNDSPQDLSVHYKRFKYDEANWEIGFYVRKKTRGFDKHFLFSLFCYINGATTAKLTHHRRVNFNNQEVSFCRKLYTEERFQKKSVNDRKIIIIMAPQDNKSSFSFS